MSEEVKLLPCRWCGLPGFFHREYRFMVTCSKPSCPGSQLFTVETWNAPSPREKKMWELLMQAKRIIINKEPTTPQWLADLEELRKDTK